MAQAQPAKLSNAEWAALSQKVADEFGNLFADAEAFLGAAGQRVAKAALKSVSMKSEIKVQDLTALLVLADLAGREKVLLDGAESLRAVPFTGNVNIYEPIRLTFCGAARRSELNGSSDSPFSALIKLPGLDESAEGEQLLRERADGGVLEPPSESDAGQATSSIPQHIINTCMAVQELWLLWVLGGSQKWPRQRIDEELESAATILRRLNAIV